MAKPGISLASLSTCPTPIRTSRATSMLRAKGRTLPSPRLRLTMTAIASRILSCSLLIAFNELAALKDVPGVGLYRLAVNLLGFYAGWHPSSFFLRKNPL